MYKNTVEAVVVQLATVYQRLRVQFEFERYMKYLIFPFPYFGNKAKRSVEFRLSISNA